jgi:hypothetical protein
MLSKPILQISDCNQVGEARNSFGGNNNSAHVHQSSVNLVKDVSTKNCWVQFVFIRRQLKNPEKDNLIEIMKVEHA